MLPTFRLILDPDQFSADIFLVCDDGAGRKSFEIWISDPSEGFTLAQRGSLPVGTQSVVFADMGTLTLSLNALMTLIYPLSDRDGTIDLLITTCALISQSTGLGTDCALNIAFNTQLPLCAATSSFPFTSGPAATAPCRSPNDLCVADSNFTFTFSGPVRPVSTTPLTHTTFLDDVREPDVELC